jgi:hypothetical protein
MKPTDLEKSIVKEASDVSGMKLKYLQTGVYGDIAAIVMLDRFGNAWAAVGANDIEKDVWAFNLLTAPDGESVEFGNNWEPLGLSRLVAESFVINPALV